MRVCIGGATGGVGCCLVRAVLASDEFTLDGAVARKAAGADVGEAIGEAPCGIMVTGDIDEALARKPDVLIDYTHPDVRMKHVMAAVSHAIPVVIGTTGFTAEEFDQLDTAARAAFGGRELPVGAITALVGGPLFLVLLRRHQQRSLGS